LTDTNGTLFTDAIVTWSPLGSAATAALLLEEDSTLTPEEVRDTMTSTALDLGTPGFDTTFGYGRLDAYAAYLDVAPVFANQTFTDTNMHWTVRKEEALPLSYISGGSFVGRFSIGCKTTDQSHINALASEFGGGVSVASIASLKEFMRRAQRKSQSQRKATSYSEFAVGVSVPGIGTAQVQASMKRAHVVEESQFQKKLKTNHKQIK